MNQADVLFVFDVGGVLIELDPAARDAALIAGRKADAGHPDFTALPRGLMRDFRLGLVDERAYLAALSAHFDVSTETILAAEDAYIAGIHADMVGFVRILKQRYRVVCLSNTQAIHWRRVSQSLLGPDLFHADYLSHLLHQEKPDPAIYRTLVAAEAAQDRRIIFIDDTGENIDAARNLGWTDALLHVSPGDTIAAVADLLGLPDETDPDEEPAAGTRH
ncbi:MAG: HAD-IA family hydrolase [Pannonibacter sp.]